VLTKKYIERATDLIFDAEDDFGFTREQRWAATRILATIIAEDNPRFQLIRFLKDCGFSKDWGERLREDKGGSDWFDKLQQIC
jgi:hypothetical protein